MMTRMNWFIFIITWKTPPVPVNECVRVSSTCSRWGVDWCSEMKRCVAEVTVKVIYLLCEIFFVYYETMATWYIWRTHFRMFIFYPSMRTLPSAIDLQVENRPSLTHLLTISGPIRTKHNREALQSHRETFSGCSKTRTQRIFYKRGNGTSMLQCCSLFTLPTLRTLNKQM